MTEDLETFLSDLRRVADAVRSEGHYEPATLMIEAARYIQHLQRLVDSLTAVPFRCNDCQRKLSTQEVIDSAVRHNASTDRDH